MLRRLGFMTLGTLCVMVTLLFGEQLYSALEAKDRLRDFDAENVYHQYEMWEINQLKTHPDYEALWVLINVDKNTLELIDLEENEVLKRYTVATGGEENPTPIGRFKIIQKSKWGSAFGTRWMKLNVPWGPYGIHGDNKPNSLDDTSASGCIRMYDKDVEELYSLVKSKTPVTITKGAFGPDDQGLRTLQPGDRGADVLEVQKSLKQRGYYKGTMDGIYGDGMKQALFNFLKERSLPMTDKITYRTYHELNIVLTD